MRVETSQRIGRAVAGGTVMAMATVFALVSLGVGAVTGSIGTGALMGAFCAGWGGVGFGVMFSGALAVLRHPDSDAR